MAKMVVKMRRISTAYAGLILLLSAAAVKAVPQISLPLNSQIPPVARVGEAFEFIFSPSTFSSTTPPIQYLLVDAPGWLELDGGLRKLHGKPGKKDVGKPTANIRASDATGSVEADVKLIVTADPRLDVKTGAPTRLGSLGATDGDGGILLVPGDKFQFSFAKDTFEPMDRIKSYAAVSSDNTPLPSWVKFDEKSLTFSGTAPDLSSLIAPPQSFGMSVIAEEYPEYRGAAVTFQMVLGAHRLYFEDDFAVANVTVGMPLQYKLPKLILDGKPIDRKNLSSVWSNATDWLSFDTQKLVLSGRPPKSAKSTSVSVLASDAFGGQARTTVVVRVLEKLLTLDIPEFKAARGEEFEYPLNDTSFSEPDVELSIKTSPSSSWVTLDKDKTIKGNVPKDAPDNVKITLTVKSSSGDISEEQTFSMVIQDKDEEPTSTARSSSGTEATNTALATVSSSSTSHVLPVTNPPISKRKKILAATLGTILPLAIFGALFVFVCYGRRKHIFTITSTDISRPYQPTPPPQMEEPWPNPRTPNSGTGKTITPSATALPSAGYSPFPQNFLTPSTAPKRISRFFLLRASTKRKRAERAKQRDRFTPSPLYFERESYERAIPPPMEPNFPPAPSRAAPDAPKIVLQRQSQFMGEASILHSPHRNSYGDKPRSSSGSPRNHRRLTLSHSISPASPILDSRIPRDSKASNQTVDTTVLDSDPFSIRIVEPDSASTGEAPATASYAYNPFRRTATSSTYSENFPRSPAFTPALLTPGDDYEDGHGSLIDEMMSEVDSRVSRKLSQQTLASSNISPPGTPNPLRIGKHTFPPFGGGSYSSLPREPESPYFPSSPHSRFPHNPPSPSISAPASRPVSSPADNINHARRSNNFSSGSFREVMSSTGERTWVPGDNWSRSSKAGSFALEAEAREMDREEARRARLKDIAGKKIVREEASSIRPESGSSAHTGVLVRL